ncbi:transcription-repair coupling factor [bacterium (Candidatus Blackallbacteria) CG17_big_fil_post_rev_8_21_14_2_50_48_46]|uniref:Transcription-repair-coupling factor n=1 Tax=bacterium (Candidatus Blackallbacteria) CG17_big_fil_post_rev_8_21_14_2_50_48_46 TaxID=2014261 RepID=A0A2M7G5A8_9BACT|nr:MAG: transcription-repair coupling factor [bacterium (Candidatus Blackallbacteria) CG18_big_fil_WC_8_21_14_2_50_49_26]PIW17157.1 MAG: transcription-repair coupling factor [bacterium (Candidatus Blackallbacteria) CG17_big_fil_post_rev_8_21_14_2_50_48_46]PIW44483.1 MAG: transcription-repair coupling factor [bacterium (Candidatus Blackallbacteria) CG13_big_fil_rev_8_21_14_2_50_49_14]
MLLASALDALSLQESLHIPNLVQPGAQAAYIARLSKEVRTQLVVVHDRKEAEQYMAYLKAFGIEDCVYYPTPALSPYEWSGDERLSCHQRHHVRYRLQYTDTPPQIILVGYKGLSYQIMDNITWYQQTLTLYPGDRLPPPVLVQRLIQLGYRPSGSITERGEFTRRGGTLDIYPMGLDRVLRLEWFDDELEKISSYRLNDPLDKPSTDKSGVIPPAYEWVIPDNLEALKTRLLENQRGNFIALVRDFSYSSELYQIMSLLHPVGGLLQCLPDSTRVVWTEGMHTKAKGYAHLLDETAQQRAIAPQHLGRESLEAELQRFGQLHFTGPDGQGSGTLLPPLEKSLDQLTAILQQTLHKGGRVTVVTPQPQRILSILRERRCPVQTGGDALSTGAVQVLQGTLPEGFAFAPLNWFCFTDKELFPGRQRITRDSKFKRNTSPLQLSLLKEGMLVVHEVHGIGRYNGLVQFSTTGETREYLSVLYAGDDRLLVPVEQMHRLQIYHGVGDQRLKLHKLGGGEWEKAKSKVKKALVEIAEQLLRTEAARMQAEGITYPPDSEWQREMEFAFPYEETPDQLKAILDTKLDMEQPVPMNRLVCGDVGFGKTEVALRAAFKAAMAGYQVALLAPTTILAHQHYQVLKDRFASYPVRVELLSRYRTAKESDQVFADLKAGAIDIVVATHRLLSKKLQMKKLGLLIIDEEHRFGVMQKEKLKDIQPGIDILTMSATPIPRTLNIALGGLKSLSLIETPPPNRQPIKTVVEPFNDEMLKQAIFHELQRGGQIYYIHNRVKDIETIGAKLQQLAPQARIRTAHGQMSKQELEQTMWDFYSHAFDILVCTTIVESGLDIANCNTLIIERVELLGLAQIHQLRGRVGRSNIQAYAYLFYDPLKPLTREARERLTVVREYSDLGSGYYVALKDMEIRGIGNLVGPQQHGNIVSVGFETYCQLLEETIALLKGEVREARESQACVIDLNLSAFIPDGWLDDVADKMRLYRILAYSDDLEQIEQQRKDLIQRKGELPPEVETLWRVTRVRIMASELGIPKIGFKGQMLELQAVLPENRFKLAIRRNPMLKNWQYKPETLLHTLAPQPLKNLQRVEAFLATLMEMEAEQLEEQPVHVE